MTTTTQAPTEAYAPTSTATPSGARSGMLLATASILATAANYLFLLIAGRLLGDEDYGALAALLGALTVVLLPTGAVQLAVSREVAKRLAAGDEDGAAAFAWAAFRFAVFATVPLLALGFSAAVPVASLLRIDSTGAVALAAGGLAAAFVFPVALGVLQGWQRFHAVGFLYVFPFALRLAFLGVVAWLGFRLGGAVYAAVGGAVVGAFLATTLIEEPLRRGARLARPPLQPFLRYLRLAVLGLVGVAVLTNADVLVVKARFSADLAGDYAAASAFARVAFFVPATILAVLFPRAVARHARGEASGDILGRSLLVTAAFGALLALVYGLAGRGLVHTSFGPEFAEAGALLPEFALVMTVYALVNLLLGYRLSQGETRYAWLVAGAIPLQLAVLAFAPGGVRGLIWANLAFAAALVVAHELVAGSSLGALRAGAEHFAARMPVRRSAVHEAILAGALFAAVTTWITWPLAPNFGSGLLGWIGADASAGIAWLWRLQQEGAYHVFGTAHHTLTGAPFGFEEANGLNLQWLLPYYPAYLMAAVIGEIAAYNVVVVSGFVLSALAMYALARHLGCAPVVAAWAGLAYTLFPAHLARVEHGSLLHYEVLVLVLAAAGAAATAPTTTRLALVGGATFLAWLTSGYFGVMSAVAVAAFACAAALARRRNRARLAVGATAAALAATAVVGVLTMLGGASASEVRDNDVGDLSIYGLRLTELVVPAPGNLVLGDRLASYHAAALHGSNGGETSNYVGLLTLALATGALVAVWRRRHRVERRLPPIIVGLAAVVVTSVVFALPSPLTASGLSWEWTPSRMVWELVPAFRVTARWTAMTMTALVPLAALGLQWGYDALKRRGGGSSAARLAPLAVVAAMAFSTLELAVPLGHKLSHAEPRPVAYDAIERAPDGLLAEYPLKRSDTYLFWQRTHGRPLVNGAPWGTFANAVERTLVDPDAPGTAERLAALGVTAIVVRPQVMHFASDEPTELVHAEWGPGYELLGHFEDETSAFRVTATPAPAVTALPGDSFVDGVVDEDGWVGHPLTGQTGRLELYARRAATVRLRFEVSPVGGSTTLQISDGERTVAAALDGRTGVGVVVQVPAGRSEVHLRVEPAPEAGVYPIEISAPYTERTKAAAQLRSVAIDAP